MQVKIHTFFYIVFLSWTFSCNTKSNEPIIGKWVMVGSEHYKNYMINCVGFIEEEKPFIYTFCKDSIVKIKPGFPSDESYYTEHDYINLYEHNNSRLIIFDPQDSIIKDYQIVYLEADSLVLKDQLLNSNEYYRRTETDTNTYQKVTKVLLSTSPSHSFECPPYNIEIQSNGKTILKVREQIYEFALSEKLTHYLFESIESISLERMKDIYEQEVEQSHTILAKFTFIHKYDTLKKITTQNISGPKELRYIQVIINGIVHDYYEKNIFFR